MDGTGTPWSMRTLFAWEAAHPIPTRVLRRAPFVALRWRAISIPSVAEKCFLIPGFDRIQQSEMVQWTSLSALLCWSIVNGMATAKSQILSTGSVSALGTGTESRMDPNHESLIHWAKITVEMIYNNELRMNLLRLQNSNLKQNSAILWHDTYLAELDMPAWQGTLFHACCGNMWRGSNCQSDVFRCWERDKWEL